MKLNDKGSAVKDLQNKLINLGYTVGNPDGIFGKKTETGVKELQTKLGLEPTGVVGPWLLSYLEKQEPKKQKTIVITAGHSNTDPGAVNGKRTEAQIALEIRNIVKRLLTLSGYNVITDGDERTNESLNQAVKLIPKGSVAIEIHLNAAANKQAGGVEALAKVKDKEFCKVLCSNIAKVLGNKVRGADGGWKAENSGQHTRLAYVSNGGIILEVFFISNDLELKTYDERKEKVAQAIVDAILAFY